MLRLYNPDDAERLSQLFHASVHHGARFDYSQEQISAWAPDEIEGGRLVPRPSSEMWVAELDGRIAGFASLEPDGHVDMLYVHPDFQGRGTARRLLAHLERIAASRAVNRLYTEAQSTTSFRSSGDKQRVHVKYLSDVSGWCSRSGNLLGS